MFCEEWEISNHSVSDDWVSTLANKDIRYESIYLLFTKM